SSRRRHTRFSRDWSSDVCSSDLGTPDFHIPLVGTWPVLGFLQDFIAVAALCGLIVFTVIRLRNSPAKLGRRSRFSGSHLGGAWRSEERRVGKGCRSQGGPSAVLD